MHSVLMQEHIKLVANSLHEQYYLQNVPISTKITKLIYF